MEPHAIICQRAPAIVKLQTRFQTHIPELNWTVLENKWKRKRATSCERAVNDNGERNRTQTSVDTDVGQALDYNANQEAAASQQDSRTSAEHLRLHPTSILVL